MNGNIRVHCFYNHNKKHGEYKEFYSNEKIHKHCFYKNDKLDGECEAFLLTIMTMVCVMIVVKIGTIIANFMMYIFRKIDFVYIVDNAMNNMATSDDFGDELALLARGFPEWKKKEIKNYAATIADEIISIIDTGSILRNSAIKGRTYYNYEIKVPRSLERDKEDVRIEVMILLPQVYKKIKIFGGCEDPGFIQLTWDN